MTASIAYLGLLDDEDILLDIAALELSALDHPGVDLAPYLAQLAVIEAEIEEEARVGEEAATGPEQAAILARILAGRHGFSGDSQSYDAPLNTDMIRVLDRRKGLPVSLAILYVALARRIGWSADALNTPGHVLVRIGPESAPIMVDPFHDGAAVTREGLLTLLRRALGQAARYDARHVAPMANRLVLVRLLLNQATRAEAEGDGGRALTLYRRIVEVAPGNAQGWWDLARLQLSTGRIDDARTSLSAMLEVTRDSGSRAHIAAALEALAGR